MTQFTTKQLFRAITNEKNWFEADSVRPAFCDKNAAAVLKHRHKKGELSEETYEKLFFHFGYKKELIWTN